MSIELIIILVIVVLVLLAIAALYNNLVTLRNMVDNAWAQVDVQLQRRFDLIANLVETVKGYAAHEKGTFEEVAKARSLYMGANSPAEKMEASNMLTSTLKTLFAVSEAYPELKANTNFLELQAELSKTEDKISYMRQSFNDTVMKYNTAIQTIPAVFFAGMMGFTKRESFDAVPEAEVAPKVQF
ncbi:MAG: LemA family protein [Coriobacteriaceae bacterium]|jgi:LemA protein|nr:LemA family protein [Coriobacteriaceae bacterium]